MALDITAFRQIQRAGDVNENNPPDHLHLLYPNTGFPGRAGNLERGYYSGAQEMHFRAGSYGGYNQWREELAKLAGYPASGRNDAHAHSRGCWYSASGPFYELINFSDCEGVIGAEAAAKLAADFAQYQAQADAHPQEWFRDYYVKWREAFEMSADAGAVNFY